MFSLCAIAPFTEFGPLGGAAILLTYLLERRRARLGAWAAGPLGLLARHALSSRSSPGSTRPAHLYVLHAIDVLSWPAS